MKRKTAFLPALIVILSVALSACIGLLPLDEKPIAGDYGPSYSSQEHQTRVFDAIWTHLQDSYIYYESADTDWEALNKKYLERINAGLSDEQFTALIQELQTELPSGSLTYQSRAERIEFSGVGLWVASLRDIITSKKAAGRPRDLAVLDILEKTLHETEKFQNRKGSGSQERS